MTTTYSTYEAKAKFSEIMRKVREGKHVYISYRGKEVAEITTFGERRQPGGAPAASGGTGCDRSARPHP